MNLEKAFSLQKVRTLFNSKLSLDKGSMVAILNSLGFQKQMEFSADLNQSDEVWFNPDLGLAHLKENDFLVLHMCFTPKLLTAKSSKIFKDFYVTEHNGGYGFKVCMAKIHLNSQDNIENFLNLPSNILIQPKDWSYDYIEGASLPELKSMNLLENASSEMKLLNSKFQKYFNEPKSQSHYRTSLNHFFCSMNCFDELPMHNWNPDLNKKQDLQKLSSFLTHNSTQKWQEVDKISRDKFGLPLFNACLLFLSYVNTKSVANKNSEFLKETMQVILEDSTPEMKKEFFKDAHDIKFIFLKWLKNTPIELEFMDFSLKLLKEHAPQHFNSTLFDFKKIYVDENLFDATCEGLHNLSYTESQYSDISFIFKKFPELMLNHKGEEDYLQSFINGYKPKLGIKDNYFKALSEFLKKQKLEYQIKNSLPPSPSSLSKLRF